MAKPRARIFARPPEELVCKSIGMAHGEVIPTSLFRKDTLMAQTIDEKAAETAPETDMVAAVLRVLSLSSEPMTVSKIRAKLPAPFRSASLEELADTLQRQVAANVLFQ